MTWRIDITTEVRSICSKLGVEYEAVDRIDLEPGLARVSVLKRNERGSVYIDIERNEHEPARAEYAFKVRA